MGEFMLSSNPEPWFESVISHPAAAMPVGRCRYGFLLSGEGTVRDDLILYRLDTNQWMAVVNAATRKSDFDAFRNCPGSDGFLTDISDSTVKIDVQGPDSRNVLGPLLGEDLSFLRFFQFRYFVYKEKPLLISRSGYTGELGYEIYTDPETGGGLWDALLEQDNVRPAGFGARDLLRLEAGLPLYGHEMDERTTPVEAGFAALLDFSREFNGRDILLKQKKTGTEKVLCGLICSTRKSPRPGQLVFSGEAPAGRITSGGFSPHLERGIALCFLNPVYAEPGTDLFIEAGRKPVEAQVAELPFIKNTSLRDGMKRRDQ
jgi:aminomethyltransferase